MGTSTTKNNIVYSSYGINEQGFSISAKIGFLMAVALLLSIDINMRLKFGSLLIHPYLLSLPILVVLLRFNLFRIPHKVLLPMCFFFIVFTIACLQDTNPLAESLKILASLLTFLFFVQTIQKTKDLELVAIGFILVGVVMGILAYQKSLIPDVNRLEGINVIEGLGNKNAQSLYTLPGLFFASLFALESIKKRKHLISAFYILSVLVIILSIALSANRSAWIGVLVIFAFLLFRGGLKFSNLILMALVFYASYQIVEKFALDVVERKIESTQHGYVSDEGRKLMFISSLQIGLDNPFLGLGRDGLHREIPKRIGGRALAYESLDAHNLYGYLMGAGGIIATLFFFRFLYVLVFPYAMKRFKGNREIRLVQFIMIGFLILFLSRSFFSREILYSPTFMGGLGIIFGYLLLQVRIYTNQLNSSTT